MPKWRMLQVTAVTWGAFPDSEIIQPTGVVPVVVKSLLFAGGVDREHLQHASAPQP